MDLCTVQLFPSTCCRRFWPLSSPSVIVTLLLFYLLQINMLARLTVAKASLDQWSAFISRARALSSAAEITQTAAVVHQINAQLSRIRRTHKCALGCEWVELC